MISLLNVPTSPPSSPTLKLALLSTSYAGPSNFLYPAGSSFPFHPFLTNLWFFQPTVSVTLPFNLERHFLTVLAPTHPQHWSCHRLLWTQWRQNLPGPFPLLSPSDTALGCTFLFWNCPHTLYSSFWSNLMVISPSSLPPTSHVFLTPITFSLLCLLLWFSLSKHALRCLLKSAIFLLPVENLPERPLMTFIFIDLILVPTRFTISSSTCQCNSDMFSHIPGQDQECISL